MKINQLKESTDETRVELVPLIDVIFCILTFFILASLSLTRQQAINMRLPKASTGTAVTQADENMIVVSLDGTGQTFVQKQPVSREQMLAQVQAFMQRRPNGVIVLNPALTASYSEVIQMLDLLRSVGGERVALPTQPTQKPTLLDPSSADPGTVPGGFAPGSTLSPSGPTSLPGNPSNSPTLPDGLNTPPVDTAPPPPPPP